MPDAGASRRGAWAQSRGLLFPVLIVTSVLVIVAPMPAIVLDLLLACNITAAVLILLTTIYVRKPLEFSVFPTLLLGTTLARLVLNVASTRLILTRGATEKTGAAGEVIQAFGEFVTGDRIVVGLILFCILIAIQFLVITKGSGRISEVAARFFLDGLPGRQMSIDADLANGVMTQDEGKRRREELSQQADFYGAMDGASKFVRGDAVASIVITVINILGGFYVGIVDGGLGVAETGSIFTKLTIGDGLVTQVPGFLIALAAGLIVTRSSVESDLPEDVVSQVFRHPEAMFLASGFLAAMSFTGLPAGPLLVLAVGCGIVGYVLLRSRESEPKIAPEPDLQAGESEISIGNGSAEAPPEERIAVEVLTVELGSGLVSLADAAAGGDLLDRVTQIRTQIAEEFGMILPKVHVRDHAWLGMNEYVIRLRGVEVARGEVWPTQRLAIDRGGARGTLPGIRVTDPVRGDDAVWIDASLAEQAGTQGFSVIEPASVLGRHLTEVVRFNADELLTRQHVYELLGTVKRRAPDLAAELTPEAVPMPRVHGVLKNLLAERIPIRDLETIVQAMVDASSGNPSLAMLTESVRASLARTICQKFCDQRRRIHAITLSSSLEDRLRAAFTTDSDSINGIRAGRLSTFEEETLLDSLRSEVSLMLKIGLTPILVAQSPETRSGIRSLVRQQIPRLVVLSRGELTGSAEVISRGEVQVKGVGLRMASS
jgi:flagellar biosynthesis protein FlhA